MIPVGLIRPIARFGFLRSFLHRRSLAMSRRPTAWHLERRQRPRWEPPEPDRRRSTFRPRLYDCSGLSGYIRYTEHFVAAVTVLAHLDMLEEGPPQWRACAVSAGFLECLLEEEAGENRPLAPAGPDGAALPDWAGRMGYFDWLESAQQEAHDNAAPHSEFLLAGFRSAENQLLDGRSVALQRDSTELHWRFLGLPDQEKEARIAEHKALRDLDPAAVAEAMVPAREAGRALGRAHRGGS